MVDGLTGAESFSQVDAADAESSAEVTACRLHLTSPTFLQVTEVMQQLSSTFSEQMANLIKEVIEPVQISVHYSATGYVDTHDLLQMSPDFVYSFAVTNNKKGYLRFDQHLPRCLTNICFGAKPSVQNDSQAAMQAKKLSKIDLYLLHGVADRLIRAWLAIWSGYFDCVDPHASGQWLGEARKKAQLAEEGCVKARFDVEFKNISHGDKSAFYLPIYFFMPLLPLEKAVFHAQNTKRELSADFTSLTLSSLLRTKVNVSAQLMTFTQPLSHVQRLKIGDVIPVSQPQTASLLIEGVNFGDAIIAQQSGHLVLQMKTDPTQGVTHDGSR